MFEAALETIQPNFPPGTLQGEPKFSNLYFNMSSGNDFKGPWNEGESAELGETFQYIEDPVSFIAETDGLLSDTLKGSERDEEEVQVLDKQMGQRRRQEIDMATPTSGILQWNMSTGTKGNGNGNGSSKTATAKRKTKNGKQK
jgi:Mn-containing catalase